MITFPTVESATRRNAGCARIRTLSYPTLTLWMCACANLGFATTPSTSAEERGDSIAAGDRVIFTSDAAIFRFKDDPTGTSTKMDLACAPERSQILIVTAPTVVASTSTDAAGTPNQSTTTTSGSVTTVTTKSAAAGETTTTSVATVARATVLRVGPRFFKSSAFKDSSGKMVCKDQKAPGAVLTGYVTVREGTVYEFTPSALDGTGNQRFGITYGVLVVPNKVIISDRSFTSSSSVLPYLGYQAWGPGWAGAWVFAAGVGTAPASTQTTPSTTGSQASTKATFSVATGMIGKFGGGTFKAGLLLGVDTAGSHAGFKYQGKPWIGISLGAGTQ